jgi:hypothetical protein
MVKMKQSKALEVALQQVKENSKRRIEITLKSKTGYEIKTTLDHNAWESIGKDPDELQSLKIIEINSINEDSGVTRILFTKEVTGVGMVPFKKFQEGNLPDLALQDIQKIRRLWSY